MQKISIKDLTKRSAEESVLNQLLAVKNPAMPSVGDIVEGTVVAADPSSFYINYGDMLTGVILGREIKRYPRVFRHLKIGDSITAKVIEVENDDGFTELSVKEAEDQKRWSTLKALKESGEAFETEILDANKGGLIVQIENIQGFMPVSQLSHENYPRVEGGDKNKIYQELQEFVGKTIRVKVLDIDSTEEKLIVSERAVTQKKMEEEIANYSVGDAVEGTVTGVVDFGAFVKFDNLEGLVHISEIDWKLIESPHDVLAVGDSVKAKIIEIEGDRISLSLKALKENPWQKVEEHYRVGDMVKGTVSKLNPFGAFIQLDEKIQGLAHVSEFDSEEAMAEALTVGKEYSFQILKIEPKEYRMALGFRLESKRTMTNDGDDGNDGDGGKKAKAKQAEMSEEKPSKEDGE